MSNAGDPRAVYCPSCGASVEMNGDSGSCTYCGTTVERQQSTGGNPRFTVTQIALGAPPASSYSTFNPPTPRRGSACLVGIVMSIVFLAVGIGLGLFLAGRASSRALPTAVSGSTPGPAQPSPAEDRIG